MTNGTHSCTTVEGRIAALEAELDEERSARQRLEELLAEALAHVTHRLHEIDERPERPLMQPFDAAIADIAGVPTYLPGQLTSIRVMAEGSHEVTCPRCAPADEVHVIPFMESIEGWLRSHLEAEHAAVLTAGG